jgi:hypothetical protein
MDPLLNDISKLEALPWPEPVSAGQLLVGLGLRSHNVEPEVQISRKLERV